MLTDCSTAYPVFHSELHFEALLKSNLKGIGSGIHCWANKAYTGDRVTSGGGFFGDNTAYNSNQKDTFEVLSGNDIPYTEYIEVKFEQAVYPVTVRVMCASGGTSLVFYGSAIDALCHSYYGYNLDDYIIHSPYLSCPTTRFDFFYEFYLKLLTCTDNPIAFSSCVYFLFVADRDWLTPRCWSSG